jgi:hypothetical protein
MLVTMASSCMDLLLWVLTITLLPAPTIKNCHSCQGVVHFENQANHTPISVHLHGTASVAPYDGWADDGTNVDYTKNYFI